ncbi:MAG: hypothetical protein J4F40_16215 [Alphaproteobacteria bacterium]|nr:hypothetical protein [Alphaproteobacteria bacterium]
MFLSRPSIPDVFSGYEGTVWIDDRAWFQDTDAIEDYIDAGRTTGTSFAFETYPSYRSTQKVRNLEIFGKVIIKGTKDFFSKVVKMFDARIISEDGMQPMLNSGLFYIASGSLVWQAWQEVTLDREN